MIETIISNLWLYGGAYFAALATASSFYAIFFFFWTRTGDRKNKIDLETKKVYLMPVYWTLRVSLVMIIISKLIEVKIAQISLYHLYNIKRSFFDIVTSDGMLFIFSILTILAINSFMMYKRKINFKYAIPVAVVTYFFLFIEITYLGQRDLYFHSIPPSDAIISKVCVYVASLVVFYSLFTFFSKKVRM